MSSWEYFIQAIRSGNRIDLRTDIQEGHLSACLSHMGNISYQTGDKQSIDRLESLIKDNSYLYQVYLDMKEHLGKHGVDLNKEQVIVGKQLSMNSKNEKFVGEHSELANLFIKGVYREPFVIPEIV